MGVYLHFESAEPAYTLKFATGGAPVTVGDALGRFAVAYGSTGHELSRADLELVDESGRSLRAQAVLPCGLPAGADVFVRSSVPPKALSAEAAAVAAPAAAAATAAAASPTIAAPASTEATGKGVSARSGSAIAASQAKMGENSYYYSVGKNRAAPSDAVVKKAGEKAEAPAAAPGVAAPSQPMPREVVERPAALPEQTFSSYSMIDDDAVVKVHINLAGAGTLPDGAIRCIFRERSFDLRVSVASEHKLLRLHIPILGEEIDPPKCVVKRKAGKLILVLAKREADKVWYELRKTKGVGDSEFGKIVPDGGEDVEFIR